MTDRGLGRLPRIPGVANDDPNDRRFMVAPPREAENIVRRTWYTRGLLDQGASPHCVAFAWRKWLLTHPVKNDLCMTEANFYALCQVEDEWPGEAYDGTSVRAGAKILKRLGYISEYRWAFDAEAAINHILSTGPMVVGTIWLSDMDQPDRDGYIHANGRERGGHAYEIVAADRELRNPDKTQGRVTMIQSWGESFRSQGRRPAVGRAFITFSDFESLISQHGEACTATEVSVPRAA